MNTSIGWPLLTLGYLLVIGGVLGMLVFIWRLKR
jgi:hypothetical protein